MNSNKSPSSNTRHAITRREQSLSDSRSLPLALGPTSRSLPISLLRARETVMMPIREMLQKSGITEQQWRVLRVVEEYPDSEQSLIAEQACISLPSLTRILRGMETQKLISRRNDCTDKRRTLVSISRRGRQIIQDNVKKNGAIFADLETHLGKRKLNQLLDLLEELQQLRL